ncbi:hypothetical protein N008_06715 [Hymenobacter sp. APR13]|nr:hypothetical protein N008_06715 [Hymenobacter sp. APR13]
MKNLTARLLVRVAQVLRPAAISAPDALFV